MLIAYNYSQFGEALNLSSDEWTSVLKLSTMWDFDAVRKAAIERLWQMKLKPVDKVVLAHKYNITDWLVPALNELAQQESLEEEDAECIAQVASWSYVLKLTKVRESLARNQANTNTAPTCSHCSHQGQFYCPNCGSTFTASSADSLNRSGHDFASTIRAIFQL
jgi:hypothetical protein